VFPEGSQQSKITNKLPGLLLKPFFPSAVADTINEIHKKRGIHLPNEVQPFSEKNGDSKLRNRTSYYSG
jgi:hypothetical protein